MSCRAVFPTGKMLARSSRCPPVGKTSVSFTGLTKIPRLNLLKYCKEWILVDRCVATIIKP